MQQTPLRPAPKSEFIPATDPLWRSTPTPWTASYGLLGLPLTVETNAPALAEQATLAFKHWGEPDSSPAPDPMCLRLLLHDVAEVLPRQPTPLMRAQEHYFLLSSGQSCGFADRRAGFAVAYITPALLGCPDHPQMARTYFAECLAMYLACGRGRAPLHAAGLKWADRGILLTGQDGAGKSTLTYACLRAGFQLLAEDIIYAAEPQEQDTLSVWGDSRFLHLLPDALRFFPELCGIPCIRQMNGETKLQLSVGELWPTAPLTRLAVAGVCSLGRSRSAESRLVTADRTEVRQALTRFKGDPPLDAAVQTAASNRLLTGPIARLETGTDFDHAVAVLKHWIEQIG